MSTFMKQLCLFFLYVLMIVQWIGAEQAKPTFLSLKGFLGKEKAAKAKKSLDAFSQSSLQGQTLLLEINSTGGDLGHVLDLAKAIYELKKLKQLKVIVYIHDNALGPAAALPFLA